MAKRLTAEQRETFNKLKQQFGDKVAQNFKNATLADKPNKAANIAGKLTATEEKAEDVATAEPAVEETPKEKAKMTAEEALAFGKEFQEGIFGTDPIFKQLTEETSPEVQALIDRLRLSADEAGKLTGLEEEALGVSREGLQGLDAPVLAAMRSRANEQITKGIQGEIARQREANRGNLIMGAAARAGERDVRTRGIQSRANVERDLIIENANQIAQARTAFTDLVRSTEDARFGRKTTSEALLGTAVTGEEAARRGRETFNVQQLGTEALTRAGAATSGAGLLTGQISAEEALAFQREAQAATEREAQAIRDQQMQIAEQQMKQTNRLINAQLASIT